MTTFQRLRALIKEWRTFDNFPPEIPESTRGVWKLAAYACAEDLQAVLDDMREQRRQAGKTGGRIGGRSKSPAKVKASRRNGRLAGQAGDKKEPE